jgi:molybdopterin synthase sulfur carrier subunit
MAELHLPTALLPLFTGLPRRLDVEAETVDDAINRLNDQWPGLKDRLCEPGPKLRPHIKVFVNRTSAELTTPLEPAARVDVIAAISGG